MMSEKNKHSWSFRFISSFICFTFLSTSIIPPSYAQTIALPLQASVSNFIPVHIQGLTINPQNPLQFDFIVDYGTESLSKNQFKAKSEQLIKYFLASLTVPEDEMWVNLSPVEKDRIISQGLGATELGKDMLGQDYLLKQYTASLMNPDKELGKKFWDIVKKQAKLNNVDVSDYNKVWIVPDKAVIYEHGTSAFIVDSHLKVEVMSNQEDMTESQAPSWDSKLQASARDNAKISEIIKTTIIPQIEKEVNEGKTFANLRQIYNSMILAVWYKMNLKESLLSKVYVDQNKTKGVNHDDPKMAEEIYQKYIKLFKDGVYQTIKEEYNPETQEISQRQYFSGGIREINRADVVTKKDFSTLNSTERSNFLSQTDKALVKTNFVENFEGESDKGLVSQNEIILGHSKERAAEYTAKLIQLADEKVKPITDAIKVLAAKPIDVSHMIIESSSKQPRQLVIHDGELERLPETNATHIVSGGNDTGTVLGVPFAPGPTSHHVTYIVPQHNIDKEKFSNDLSKQLKNSGIHVRTLSASSRLRSDEGIVVDNKTISVKEIPGLGTQIDMYLWYDTGAKYSEFASITDAPLKTVKGSLQQKSYVNLPKLGRPIRVAINGARGRIGSLLLRHFLKYYDPSQIQVVAVNGSTPEALIDTLKADSTHGQLLEKGDSISIGQERTGEFKDRYYIDATMNGLEHKIYVTNDRGDLKDLPWKNFNVDLVYEATGQYETPEELRGHIEAGATKVTLTAPGKVGEFETKPVPIVMGVNQLMIPLESDVFDCASCTTGSAASPLKALIKGKGGESWKIISGDLQTTHALTQSNSILDSSKGLSGMQNMLLGSTGAAKALKPLITDLKSTNLSANSLRIPTPDGSLTILNLVVKVPEGVNLTKELVNERLKEVSQLPENKGVFSVDEGTISSAQILGRSESGVIVSEGTQVKNLENGFYRVKLLSWYDNEWGYAAQAANEAYFHGKAIIDAESKDMAISNKEEAIAYVQSLKDNPEARKNLVIIVGTGPAGLRAGELLLQKGYKLAYFEKEMVHSGLGGFGIPDIGPQANLKENTFALGLRVQADIPGKQNQRPEVGQTSDKVRMFYNVKIGEDIAVNDLESLNVPILIAVGAQKPKRLNVKGQDLKQIVSATHTYFRKVNTPWINSQPEVYEQLYYDGPAWDYKNNVVVNGGGNVASDAILDAHRNVPVSSDRKLTLIYRGPAWAMYNMNPKYFDHIEEANHEGANIKLLGLRAVDEYLDKNNDGKVDHVRLRKYRISGLLLDKEGLPQPLLNSNTEKPLSLSQGKTMRDLLKESGIDILDELNNQLKPGIVYQGTVELIDEYEELPVDLMVEAIGDEVEPLEGLELSKKGAFDADLNTGKVPGRNIWIAGQALTQRGAVAVSYRSAANAVADIVTNNPIVFDDISKDNGEVSIEKAVINDLKKMLDQLLEPHKTLAETLLLVFNRERQLTQDDLRNDPKFLEYAISTTHQIYLDRTTKNKGIIFSYLHYYQGIGEDGLFPSAGQLNDPHFIEHTIKLLVDSGDLFTTDKATFEIERIGVRTAERGFSNVDEIYKSFAADLFVKDGVEDDMVKEIKKRLKNSLAEIGADLLQKKDSTAKGRRVITTINEKNADIYKDPQVGKEDVNIGILAISANPPHWGQLETALRAMADQNLDQVVVVVQGDDYRKPILGKTEEARHTMVKEFLKQFQGLVTYSDWSKGNQNIGERSLEEMIIANKDRPGKVTWHYIVGNDHMHWYAPDAKSKDIQGVRLYPKVGKGEDGYDPDTIQHLYRTAERLKQEYPKLNAKMRVGFNTRDRQDGVSLEVEQEILDRVKNEGFYYEVSGVNLSGVSSTVLREVLAGKRDLSEATFMPKSIYDYIMANDEYRELIVNDRAEMNEVEPAEVLQEKQDAKVVGKALHTILDPNSPFTGEFINGGFNQIGYGVPVGAAIDGNFAIGDEGNQGYFVDKTGDGRSGKQVFLDTVQSMKDFFAKREKRNGKPVKLVIKTGIGGQHTPFQGIADALRNGSNNDTLIVGEYELGKDYEKYLTDLVGKMNISWDQIAVIPSSKSGSTDETMMIFVDILKVLLEKVAAENKITYAKGFAQEFLNYLHDINFDGTKEKSGTDLFKGFNFEDMMLWVKKNVSYSVETDDIKKVLKTVLGNMFFETVDRPSASRLSAFVRNSGLDKLLGEDAPGFGAMFDNVGGRWTADLHMMTFLAFYNLDAEKYWKIRYAGIQDVRQGDSLGNDLGNKIIDENISEIALVLPDELFWFGKSVEQNFNESIWQDGFANIRAIKESQWENQEDHYAGNKKAMVINMSRQFSLNHQLFNEEYVSGISYGLNLQNKVWDFAELFTTFYGMTYTVGTRLIARELAKQGLKVEEIDVNDLDNPATKIFQDLLFLRQPFVELGKGLLEKRLKDLQDRQQEWVNNGSKGDSPIVKATKDIVSLLDRRSSNSNMDSVNAKISVADQIAEVAKIAREENRLLVPFIYVDGEKFVNLRNELVDMGIPWVLQGTGDQHISYQQVLRQPKTFLPVIISMVPETDHMVKSVPAVGFAKGYLDNISPNLVRDYFAQASYEALTDLRQKEGGKGLYIRMLDTSQNRRGIIEAFADIAQDRAVTETVPAKDLEVSIKFGTSGWRSSTDKEFTIGNVNRVAQAAAKVLIEQNPNKKPEQIRVAVGYDARPRAREFAMRISEVLAANGIHTDLIDQVTPTPVMAEATRKNLSDDKRYDVAFHVTASHNEIYTSLDENAGLWQGIKVLQEGVPASDEFTARIARAANDKNTNGTYKVSSSKLYGINTNLLDGSNERLDRVFNFNELKSKIPAAREALGKKGYPNFGVVIDSMGGTTSVAAKVISRLGIVENYLGTKFVYQRVEDGTFVNEITTPSGKKEPWSPNPTKPYLLKELLNITIKGKFGAALDGDGDRVTFKDISGKFIEPNDLGLIFAHYLYEKGERGAIVRTIPTTRSLDRFAKRHGLTMADTPVGSKHFKPYATGEKEDLLVGIEESGHVFFKYNGEIFADSGIAEVLLALEIIIEKQMSLSDYLAEIQKEEGQGELFYNRDAVNKDIVTDDFRNKLAAMRKLDRLFPMEFARAVGEAVGKELVLVDGKIAENAAYDLRDKDGVAVSFADGTFVMYRISGTDGSIRIYAEDETPEGLDNTIAVVSNVLQGFVNGEEVLSEAQVVSEDKTSVEYWESIIAKELKLSSNERLSGVNDVNHEFIDGKELFDLRADKKEFLNGSKVKVEAATIYFRDTTTIKDIAQALADYYKNEKVSSDMAISENNLESSKYWEEAIYEKLNIWPWEKLSSTNLSNKTFDGKVFHDLEHDKYNALKGNALLDVGDGMISYHTVATAKHLAEALAQYHQKDHAVIVTEDQISNEAVRQWVNSALATIEPGEVRVLSGTDVDELEEEAIASGEAFRTNEGNLFARSNKNDVARVESRTIVATSDKKDQGKYNNWMNAQEARAKFKELSAGKAKGKTIYVIPYLMGPVGAPNGEVGVQITDNRMVALNMYRMVRVGLNYLNDLNLRPGQSFWKGIQITGDLDAIKRTNGSDDGRLFLNLPETGEVLSIGSGYGGNVLLPKKFGALRQKMWDDWAEHMLILEVENLQNGDKKYVTAAFPSASGKTNLSMLEPPAALKDKYVVRVVGDDIAWLRQGDDGRIYAINPENGFFGVIYGTSEKTNPNFVKAIRPNSGTIFTNVAWNSVTKEIWWEGKTKDYPSLEGDGQYWEDWKGDKIIDRPEVDKFNKKIAWAHPNSRATTYAKNAPNLSTEFDNPKGVPISAILWGGRVGQPGFEPLIRQLPSMERGIYDGATMIVESTAAASDAEKIRPDPMAQRPFFSKPELDYFNFWLSESKKLENPPAFFHVNWFRQDENGSFIWPGFGDNLRALLWALDRADGKGEGVETPIGVIPTKESLNLDGLNLSDEQLKEVLDYNPQLWKDEVERQRNYLLSLETENYKVPADLLKINDDLKKALDSMTHNYRFEYNDVTKQTDIYDMFNGRLEEVYNKKGDVTAKLAKMSSVEMMKYTKSDEDKADKAVTIDKRKVDYLKMPMGVLAGMFLSYTGMPQFPEKKEAILQAIREKLSNADLSKVKTKSLAGASFSRSNLGKIVVYREKIGKLAAEDFYITIDEGLLVNIMTGQEKRQKENDLHMMSIGSPLMQVDSDSWGDKAVENLGGINLDAKLLNLQIKRDGKGIPLPMNQQPLMEMKIDGFAPVIINIQPIQSLPLLLGIADEVDAPLKSAQADEKDKLSKIRFEYLARELAEV